MRTACNDVEIAKDENGKIFGICFGYDYCAEHEWGIKGIRRSLGIWEGDPKTEEKVFGFARHIISNGDKVKFLKYQNKYYIYLVEKWSYQTDEDYINSIKKMIKSHTYSSRDILSMWGENAFLFGCSDKEAMKAIHTAFINNNIVYGFKGSNNPFGGRGLYFGIRSELSDEDEAEVIQSQKDELNKWKEVYANGILDRLEKAGCKYFACSPRRIEVKDSNGQQESSALKDIIFWLNPQNQQNNDFGWFTVEQLDQWTKGEGPIPLKNKKESVK